MVTTTASEAAVEGGTLARPSTDPRDLVTELTPSSGVQFVSVFKKRLLYSRRDPVATLCGLFCPSITILVFLISLVLQLQDVDTVKLDINSLYVSNVIAYGGIPDNDFSTSNFIGAIPNKKVPADSTWKMAKPGGIDQKCPFDRCKKQDSSNASRGWGALVGGGADPSQDWCPMTITDYPKLVFGAHFFWLFFI